MARSRPVATCSSGAARCRRVRLRHRAAGGRRLHHDAQVPPQYLPGRCRHPGSGASQEVLGAAGACGELLLLHRRRGARADGPAWHQEVQRPDRPRRPAQHEERHRALEGQGLDYSRIFHLPDVPAKVSRRHTETQDHGLDKALDNELIRLAEPALERGERVSIDLPVRNINRTVGASLSGAVAANTVTRASRKTPSTSGSPALPVRVSGPS